MRLALVLGMIGLGSLLGVTRAALLPSHCSSVKPLAGSVSVAEAHSALMDGGVTFLDARAQTYYRQGHIPGALGVPYAMREPRSGYLAEAIPRERHIIVYCYDSRCGIAGLFANWLRRKGWSEVAVLEGGMEAWKRAELPVRQ